MPIPPLGLYGTLCKVGSWIVLWKEAVIPRDKVVVVHRLCNVWELLLLKGRRIVITKTAVKLWPLVCQLPCRLYPSCIAVLKSNTQAARTFKSSLACFVSFLSLYCLQSNAALFSSEFQLAQWNSFPSKCVREGAAKIMTLCVFFYPGIILNSWSLFLSECA